MKEETPDDDMGKKGRVVVYVTSIKAIRETSENCRRVLHTLKAHHIDFTVKDVNLHPDYSKELRERLHNSSFTLPQVSIATREFFILVRAEKQVLVCFVFDCIHNS